MGEKVRIITKGIGEYEFFEQGIRFDESGTMAEAFASEYISRDTKWVAVKSFGDLAVYTYGEDGVRVPLDPFEFFDKMNRI